MARWLRRGDPGLAPTADLRRAAATIEAYAAPDPARAHARERILAFLREEPRPLERANRTGHLTASALVLDAEGRRALLTHHGKLGRWLQLGGHCDGDANLAGVALREAVEESGIEDLAIDPRPLDLDVHPIPARPGEPRHLHLDTCFLVRAPRGARERCGSESIELAWVAPGELARIAADASLRRLFRRALAQLPA